MWKVEYCIAGDRKIEKTEVETEPELRRWVEMIEKMFTIQRSIFDQPQYINTPTSKQWGTGYWWLSVEGETGE